MEAIVVGLSGVKVYIVVGSVCCLLFFWSENSSEFSGCYHESVLSPPIAQLISASHIKTAPSCIRELVNE